MSSVTVAAILERYIQEMPLINPDKPIGTSHLYTLRRLQGSAIGRRPAAKLTKGDVIEHCKQRRAAGVQPQTINQDITYLAGPLKFAGAAWDDCEDVSAAAIAAAMPLLKKYQLIGKSRPRSRRPSDDEIERLLAYYSQPPKKNAKNHIYAMRDIVEFSIYSARRISETCRLRWGDVNGEDMTCVVRDMKDPRQKKGNDHVFPLLGRAWDIVMAQPRKNPANPEERIFPFNAKSVGAKYTRAKNALGIENLRLHDNRREAASRAFEGTLNGRKYGVPEVMVLTGHKNPQMLMRVYTKLNARDLQPKKEAA